MDPYKRFPRTLSEAFGPYTDDRVEPVDDSQERRNAELTWAGIACAVVGIGGMLIMWFAS